MTKEKELIKSAIKELEDVSYTRGYQAGFTEGLEEGKKDAERSEDTDYTEVQDKTTDLAKAPEDVSSNMSTFMYASDANKKRKEVIELAKDYVNIEKHLSEYDIEFSVNKEKKTVVCLLTLTKLGNKTGKPLKKVYHRGVAKCEDGDVFNLHIGKAIALTKAIKNHVPEVFLNSTQPDTPVVGMYVFGGTNEGTHYSTNYKFKLIGKNNQYTAFNYCRYNQEKDEYVLDALDYIYKEQIGKIIDDSEAEYTEFL